MNNKIRSIDDLAVALVDEKAHGKSVVLCHGVFDLMHPGHIRHLGLAKREGDVLVVTVTPDAFVNKGPGRPVFNERLRAESIAALEDVDYVAVNEWPKAVETIHKLKPDVFVKGDEYVRREGDVTGHIVDEEEAVEAVGGKMRFTSDITFSSTKLLNSYFSALPEETAAYLNAFRKRYSADEVIERLRSLRTTRVLIVGDTIIDEYHYAKVLGQASKSVALNARFIEAETYPGGVLAIANHVAGFCEHVQVVSCVGQTDPRLDYITTHLKPNVSTKFFARPDGPTTVKRRYTDRFLFSKLFEVTFVEDRPLPAEVSADLNHFLERAAPDYDLVIVGDFGHGLIGAETIDVLARQSRFMALNAQANSTNQGFNTITRYPRADYVCIDQEEMRLAYYDRFGPVDELMRRTRERLATKLVSVTQGTEGSLTLAADDAPIHTPVFSKEVVDTVGAGDAYLSVTAPCAAAGFPADLIAFIGNATGAMAVRYPGNRESVEPVPLYKFVTTLLK